MGKGGLVVNWLLPKGASSWLGNGERGRGSGSVVAREGLGSGQRRLGSGLVVAKGCVVVAKLGLVVVW